MDLNRASRKSRSTASTSPRAKPSQVEYDADDQGKPSCPRPNNFEEFLPWACRQYSSLDVMVKVKNVQAEYGSDKTRSKVIKKKGETHRASAEIVYSMLSDIGATAFNDPLANRLSTQDFIKIEAVFDRDDNLVKIQILRNKTVPRRILRIISLIINFYPYLESITIDEGMDQATIYELSKLIPMSHITELCLDGTFLEQANYYLLLDNPNSLKYLSLSKCRITDKVVGTIAERLEYPRPASKTLSILYLSMNRITDVGARLLAKALRSNRQLSYLNLAGNMISDNGAHEIFNVLLEFPLTDQEIEDSQTRRLEYFMSKFKMLCKLRKEQTAKKNALKGPALNTSMPNVDINTAMDIDPFASDIVRINDAVYSTGNNTLAYINLAYNNLTQCTLKKIIEVLGYQNSVPKNSKGLVNLNIEGNLFDTNSAKYLYVINSMIDTALSFERAKSALTKKPKPAKQGSGK